ncbi:MAG: LLM class flavin-dependent oxidoreductase [Acidimicrobiales bacterium]
MPPWPHPPGTGTLQLGVFLPVANNGWVLSSEADPAPPTFAEPADRPAGRGHGPAPAARPVRLAGPRRRDRLLGHQPGGFTLLAALAACTERLTLVASVPPLLYPPAVAAKMVATLDEVSGAGPG